MVLPIDIKALESAIAAQAKPGDALALAPAPIKLELAHEQKRALAAAQEGAGPRKVKGDLLVEALALIDADKNLEGVRLALEAVKQMPESMPAYLGCAVALDRLGYLAEALEFYEQANQRSPNNPAICSLIGMTAQRCNAPEIAERCYILASQLEPGEAQHTSNLAGVMRDLGKFEGAIDVLRNRLYVEPDNADLWNTLGTVLQEQGDPEQAVTFLTEATRLRPGFARAYHNLGASLTDLARSTDARVALDTALSHATNAADRAEMRHARAWALLGEGRLGEGWDDYEARFDPLTHDPQFFQAPRPRWEGEPLTGKGLMVLGEQGLGDEVMFTNAMADVIEALGPTGKLTIACERRLVSLFARSFPTAKVIAHYTGTMGQRKIRMAHPASEWDGIDLWAPLGALVKHFRRTVSAYPQAAGFLRADPARVAGLKEKIAGAPGLKIGILWKSLVMTPKRSRFFAPFAAWAPLLQAPGVSLFNLQYGDSAAEVAYARDKLGVELRAIEGLDVKDDLEGVSAAGQALDLVIGPMTATTNLAAACGGNVWFWHRYGSWIMHGTDSSPWYPHTRTFRAPSGAWRKMFEEMASELAARAAQKAA
jgi:tetratricopeptide (TPR) repeat protein